MKFRHTLLLSALVAAPLVTESAAARSLVQLYKDLAAEPHSVTVDAKLRASNFPALAVMPADVEACVAVSDFTAGAVKPTLPMLEPGKGFDNPKVKEYIEDFGFAVGKGNAAAAAAFMPLYQYLAGRVDYPARAQAWTESARAEYSGIIGEQVHTQATKPALDAIRKVKEMHLHPVYLAFTADVPAHRYLMDVAEDYIAAYEKQYGGTRVEENGCKGIKVPFKSLFEMPEGDATIESTLRDEISARSVYLMFKQQGGVLVAVLCEDPKEINIVDSADKSVLGASSMSFCDSYLNAGVEMAAYISPDLYNAASSYQEYDIKALADFAQDVFRAMGKEDDSNVAAYNAAANSIKPLLNYVSSYVRTDADKPFSFCVWPQEDGKHVKIHFDAYDSTFKPGNIRLARVARSEKVLFYAESTEETTENPRKTIDALEPAIQVAAGYITSMEPAAASAAGGDALLKYMPRFRTFMKSLRAVDKALGDVPAFVVMPLKDGSMAASYFNSVKDRAALGKAGDELVTAVGRMIGNKADTLRKKVKSKKGKTLVSHTADMSDIIPGAELNATISEKDKTFAFGNSSALNGQMIKYGNGKINFSGAVYTIRPAALAIATNAAPEAALIAPMLQGIGAVHVTNTIKNDVRTLHILLANPGEEAEEE